MHRRGIMIGSAIALIVIVALYTTLDSKRVYQSDSVGMNTVAGSAAPMMVTEEIGVARDMAYGDAGIMQKIAPPVPYPPGVGSGGITTVDTRMIIKTGSFSVRVDNVAQAADTIVRAAEEQKGIVVSNQLYNMSAAPNATIVVRVPADSFNAVIAKIREVGVVESESMNGQDVTEEYVDLDAQLTNLKAGETQFLEIMKRATNIQDILAVQRELTNIRSQIESLEGRMKYLSESAEYSTITVYLSGNSASLPVLDETDDWKFKGEVKEALRSLVSFGKELVSVIVKIAVFVPVWGVVIIIGWVMWRKIQNKK